MTTLGAAPRVAPRIGEPTMYAAIGSILHGFVTTMGMIMVINCVVAGVVVALAAVALGAGDGAALGAGVAGAIVLLAAQAGWGLARFRVTESQMTVRFPTPRDTP
jgi:hypothetical protein